MQLPAPLLLELELELLLALPLLLDTDPELEFPELLLEDALPLDEPALPLPLPLPDEEPELLAVPLPLEELPLLPELPLLEVPSVTGVLQATTAKVAIKPTSVRPMTASDARVRLKSLQHPCRHPTAINSDTSDSISLCDPRISDGIRQQRHASRLGSGDHRIRDTYRSAEMASTTCSAGMPVTPPPP